MNTHSGKPHSFISERTEIELVYVRFVVESHFLPKQVNQSATVYSAKIDFSYLSMYNIAMKARFSV